MDQVSTFLPIVAKRSLNQSSIVLQVSRFASSHNPKLIENARELVLIAKSDYLDIVGVAGSTPAASTISSKALGKVLH